MTPAPAAAQDRSQQRKQLLDLAAEHAKLLSVLRGEVQQLLALLAAVLGRGRRRGRRAAVRGRRRRGHCAPRWRRSCNFLSRPLPLTAPLWTCAAAVRGAAYARDYWWSLACQSRCVRRCSVNAGPFIAFQCPLDFFVETWLASWIHSARWDRSDPSRRQARLLVPILGLRTKELRSLSNSRPRRAVAPVLKSVQENDLSTGERGRKGNQKVGRVQDVVCVLWSTKYSRPTF